MERAEATAGGALAGCFSTASGAGGALEIGTETTTSGGRSRLSMARAMSTCPGARAVRMTA
jgi:hypothetical protein